MKAMLTLDDDVAARLEQARRERGKSLQEVGNELLRRILDRLASPHPSAPDRGPLRPRSSRIQPHSSGRCLLDNLDNIAEVLAAAEGKAFR